MSLFGPNSRHLREVFIFGFHLRKTAAEAHRLLLSTYGEAHLSERTCREWCQHFKSGNVDVEDGLAVEKRKFSKIPNWRHYLLNTRIKRKKNWQNQLFQRQNWKEFLHRIVIGDEKWVHYNNPKRRKSWGMTVDASTSMARPNIHGA